MFKIIYNLRNKEAIRFLLVYSRNSKLLIYLTKTIFIMLIFEDVILIIFFNIFLLSHI